MHRGGFRKLSHGRDQVFEFGWYSRALPGREQFLHRPRRRALVVDILWVQDFESRGYRCDSTL